MGWIADSQGLEVVGPTEEAIDGATAIVFDLRLTDEFRCGGCGCLDFVGNPPDNIVSFIRTSGESYRVYWLDQPGEAPIVIVASEVSESPSFAPVEEIVETMALDDIQPHPFGERPWEVGASGTVPSGRTLLPIIDGLEFDLSSERPVTQEPGFVSFEVGGGDTVRIISAASTASAQPITDTDQLLVALTNASTATITRLDSITVASGPARIVTIRNEREQPAPIRTSPAAAFSPWKIPISGQAWIIETERGLLIISAEGSAEGPGSAALDMAERIVASLEVVD